MLSPERVLDGQLVGADDPRLPGRGWSLDPAWAEAALSPLSPQRVLGARADRPQERVLVDAGVHLTSRPASLLVLVQSEGDGAREAFLAETLRILSYDDPVNGITITLSKVSQEFCHRWWRPDPKLRLLAEWSQLWTLSSASCLIWKARNGSTFYIFSLWMFSHLIWKYRFCITEVPFHWLLEPEITNWSELREH